MNYEIIGRSKTRGLKLDFDGTKERLGSSDTSLKHHRTIETRSTKKKARTHRRGDSTIA